MITWEWMVTKEPRLQGLLDLCKAVNNPDAAFDHWFGPTGLKREMCALVGMERRDLGHPDLFTSDAYDIAYDRLLGLLERGEAA